MIVIVFCTLSRPLFTIFYTSSALTNAPFYRWCQSYPTSLGIGPGSGPFEHTFKLPIDLLYHRSRVFRDLIIETQNEELPIGRPRFVLPTSISPHTIEDFLIWSLSHSPQIATLEPSFLETTNLGVFAQQYHIPALTNQITDCIRAHIASDEWTLQASLVDAIYGAAPAGTPLREVVRAALGKLPKLTGGDEGANDKSKAERDEWKEVILKHSQLGWDFIEAGGEKWTAQAYLNGVCRFHDHADVKGQKAAGGLCDGCPYAAEDCFPILEQNAAEENRSLKADQRKPNAAIDPDAMRISIPADAPISAVSDQMLALQPEDAKSPVDGPRVGNSVMVMDTKDDMTDVNASLGPQQDGNGNMPPMDLIPGDRSLETSAQPDNTAPKISAASKQAPTDFPADDINGNSASDDVDEPLTPVQEEHEPVAATPYQTKQYPIGLKAVTSLPADAHTSTSDHPDLPVVTEMAERTFSQDTTSAESQKEAGTMTDVISGATEELVKNEVGDSELKMNRKNKKKKKRGNSISVAA